MNLSIIVFFVKLFTKESQIKKNKARKIAAWYNRFIIYTLLL